MLPEHASFYVQTGFVGSGWIDQSWQLAEALSKRGDSLKFKVVQSATHFDLVDRLCDPDKLDGSQLHQWILNLAD